jgi:ATP-binding cassette subfamily B protein
MKRAAALFRPYRAYLAAVLVVVLLSSALWMLSPFVIRQVLDVAIPQRRESLLQFLVAMLVAIAVVIAALGALQTWLTNLVGQRVMHDLRSAIYQNLGRMSLGFFTRAPVGEVQARINSDVAGVDNVITNTVSTILSSLAISAAIAVGMFILDWRLALVTVALLPIFCVVSRGAARRQRVITLARQTTVAEMSTLVAESLSVSGILLSRSMNGSRPLHDRFDQQSRHLAELAMRQRVVGRWWRASFQTTFVVMPALTYLLVGETYMHGSSAISIGTLVAFTTLQTRLLSPVSQLLSIGVQLHSALALFERIYEYLDFKPEITQSPAASSLPDAHGCREVRFEDVWFRYSDEAPWVLRGIDLVVAPGSRLAIVGRSGVGKTTLAYLIGRLYDVTRGRVLIDGVDVRALTFASLAGAVGFVSQEIYLFHGTVRDNLRFAKPTASDEELVDAARAALIHDVITDLPQGYETLVGQRGHRFSGGERQRIAIARTLLRNPPVLVLDEATSALDGKTERLLHGAVEWLAAGRTTIVIAHRLSTVRNAQQIVVLDGGSIVERGTHEELVAAQGQYRALLESTRTVIPDVGTLPTVQAGAQRVP